jgi:hypothetical protein
MLEWIVVVYVYLSTWLTGVKSVGRLCFTYISAYLAYLTSLFSPWILNLCTWYNAVKQNDPQSNNYF